MKPRPYCSLRVEEFTDLISKATIAGDTEKLAEILAELSVRTSRPAQKLRAQLEASLEVHHKPAGNQSITATADEWAEIPSPRLQRELARRSERPVPGSPTILELTNRAEAAMMNGRDDEVQELEKLLELRCGEKALFLHNRLIIYLSEKGLKPEILPNLTNGQLSEG